MVLGVHRFNNFSFKNHQRPLNIGLLAKSFFSLDNRQPMTCMTSCLGCKIHSQNCAEWNGGRSFFTFENTYFFSLLQGVTYGTGPKVTLRERKKLNSKTPALLPSYYSSHSLHFSCFTFRVVGSTSILLFLKANNFNC